MGSGEGETTPNKEIQNISALNAVYLVTCHRSTVASRVYPRFYLINFMDYNEYNIMYCTSLGVHTQMYCNTQHFFVLSKLRDTE